MAIMSPADRLRLRQAFDNVVHNYRLAVVTGTPFIPIQDRFTTKWSGPNDLRAKVFKEMEDSQNDNVRPTLNIVPKGKAALAWANQAADEYQRLRHGADQGINDGNSIGGYDWGELTRGEKLRWLSQPLRPYGDHQGMLRSLIKENEAILDDEVGGISFGEDFRMSPALFKCAVVSMKEGSATEEMQSSLMLDDQRMDKLKHATEKLLKLVTEEVEDAWDWNLGISEQERYWLLIRALWMACTPFFWIIVWDEIEGRRGPNFRRTLWVDWRDACY